MPAAAAHAKINLFLHVLAREDSGYHSIETLFCRIALADDVSIEAGPDGIDLAVAGNVPGDPRDNLVHRAAAEFHDRTGLRPAVRIRLTKRIPVGAGLGGGSSDAATTIRLLDAMHGEPLGPEGRLALGARLGSDVAFFLTGSDLALGWGRGERLLELDALPEAPVLLVVPSEPMSTAEAYAALAGRRRDAQRPSARSIASARLGEWGHVARLAGNDFETVVFERFPTLAAIRDTMRADDARIALLSGSGSALFGVFDDVHACENAAVAMQRQFPDVRLIRTVTTTASRR